MYMTDRHDGVHLFIYMSKTQCTCKLRPLLAVWLYMMYMSVVQLNAYDG